MESGAFSFTDLTGFNGTSRATARYKVVFQDFSAWRWIAWVTIVVAFQVPERMTSGIGTGTANRTWSGLSPFGRTGLPTTSFVRDARPSDVRNGWKAATSFGH